MPHQNLSPTVIQLLHKIEQGTFILPSLPDIAARIRQLKKERFENENLRCQMLANIITTDPVLSARILALSNQQIVQKNPPNLDVDQAVASLGFHLCCNAAIGLALKKAYVSQHSNITKEMSEHWHYTAAVAVTAVAIAEHIGSVNPAQAMLAALLHRIGALALLKYADQTPSLSVSLVERTYLIEQTASMVGDFAIAVWDLPERYSALARDVADFRCQRRVSDLVHVVRVAICLVSTQMTVPFDIPDWDNITSFEKLGFKPSITDDKQLMNFVAALQSRFLNHAA